MRTTTELRHELELLLRARTPAVGLQTWEEARTLKLIREVARLLSPPRDVFVWTSALGLCQENQPVPGLPVPCSLEDALATARDFAGPALFVFLDADLLEPRSARSVRDLLLHVGSQPRSLLFVSPRFELHPSLVRSLSLLEVPTPERSELKNLLHAVAARCVSVVGVEVQLTGEAPDRLADAAVGMTGEEAERAFVRALLEAQRLSIHEVGIVLREKLRLLQNDGLLHVVPPEGRIEDLTGMDHLRAWLIRRGRTFSVEAEAAGIPAPLGVLLIGMTGSGRARLIRGLAGSWQLPLLRVDLARIIGQGLEAETALRDSLRRLEALAPCLLWIPGLDRLFEPGDEAEGGIPANPCAVALLSWLQTPRRSVFVIATAHDQSRLPLELIWKGAFDEVFTLDYPNSDERRFLLQAIIEKRRLQPLEANIEMLVAASEGFSSVQIEQAILRGQVDAFDNGRPVRMVDVVQVFRTMTPVAGFMSESRRKLKSWAHRRAVAASPARDS